MSAERPDLFPERGDPAAMPAADTGSAPAGPVTRVRACVVVLGGVEFAVDVRCLREVMVVEKVTVVPGAPPFVRGAANLRGEIIAILDIAPVLDLPATRVGPSGKALVLEPAASQVAIAVDEVLGLETFDEYRPRHDDPVSAPRAAFEGGWVEREGRLVTLLDVPEIVEALKIRSREATGSPR